MAEIDAPKKGQAWGNRSRRHLAAVERPAVVRRQTTDRYGRTVARVECDGTDASAEQVRAGLAWVFNRYVRDRSLYAVQEEARDERRGLWADREPVPTWEWRALMRARYILLLQSAHRELRATPAELPEAAERAREFLERAWD